MTTDLRAFCITDRKTIADSRGDGMKKGLMEIIRAERVIGITALQKRIRKESKFFRTAYKSRINDSQVKELIQCMRWGHDIVWEYW